MIMIDEEKLKIAVSEFTKNPYWKAKLDEAPTELSKRDTELDFYYSFYFGKLSDTERKEVDSEGDRLKNSFGLADWEHALKYCGHNPFHAICTRKIAELSRTQE